MGYEFEEVQGYIKLAERIVSLACSDYMNACKIYNASKYKGDQEYRVREAKEWFYSPRGRLLLQGIDPDTVIKALDRRVELGLADKVTDGVNDGSKLRKYRDIQGNSLTEVSKITGVSNSHISDIENGLKKISMKIEVKLLKYYPEKIITEYIRGQI